MASCSSTGEKKKQGGKTEVASWDVNNSTNPVPQREPRRHSDTALLQKWPLLSFDTKGSSSYYSHRFNASEILIPETKSIYKDSGTDPVNNDEGEEADDSNRANADHISRERRGIARVRAKVHQIGMLRSNVVAKQVRMRELHNRTKQKREEELEQRVVLMQAINTFCAHIETQRDSKTIEASHEQLQSTTDEYMELERRYNEEENELQQREIDLDMVMDRLSELLEGPGIADQEAEGDQSVEFMDDTDSDDDDMFSKTMHPLLIEYLERTGDVEIYEERVRDIYQEYHEALQKKEVRSRVNLPLDQESQKILNSYEEEHTKAERQLDDAINEANRLQKLCEEEGLIGEQNVEDNMTYLDPDDDEDDNDNDNDNDSNKRIKFKTKLNAVAREREQEQQPNDPLKADMDGDTHPFFEPQDSSTSGKFDRCTFINKWLLHQLRHSSLQILRLKALLKLQYPEVHGMDDIFISQQVLDVWYIDDERMAEAPVSPSITEYAVPPEYAKAGDDGESTVTIPRNDSQDLPQPVVLGFCCTTPI